MSLGLINDFGAGLRSSVSAKSPSLMGSFTCKTPTAKSFPATKPALIRHNTHYYRDANFCFIVGNIVFRTYQGLLARRSSVFRDLFDLPPSPASDEITLVDSPESLSPPGSFLSLSSDCSLPSYRSKAPVRVTAGQVMIDGVPAVHLRDDDPATFANLLTIIMPGKAVEVVFGLAELMDLVSLCDKYLIDDIRNECLYQINEMLPSSIGTLDRLEVYWGDVGLIGRVIEFSTRHGGEHYLPLALYTLAFHQWDGTDAQALASLMETLSMVHPQMWIRILTARSSLQEFLVEHAPARLPDLGLAVRPGCKNTFFSGKERSCGLTREDGWKEPMDLMGALLRGPLEVLSYRARHPPRRLCDKCSVDYISGSRVLEAEVFRRVQGMFLPKKTKSSKLGSK